MRGHIEVLTITADTIEAGDIIEIPTTRGRWGEWAMVQAVAHSANLVTEADDPQVGKLAEGLQDAPNMNYVVVAIDTRPRPVLESDGRLLLGGYAPKNFAALAKRNYRVYGEYDLVRVQHYTDLRLSVGGQA